MSITSSAGGASDGKLGTRLAANQHFPTAKKSVHSKRFSVHPATQHKLLARSPSAGFEALSSPLEQQPSADQAHAEPNIPPPAQLIGGFEETPGKGTLDTSNVPAAHGASEPASLPTTPANKRVDVPGSPDQFEMGATLPLDSKGTAFWPAGYVHAAVVALGGDRGVTCTGTVVKPRLVLTARHCQNARWVLVHRGIPFKAVRIAIRRFVGPPNAFVDVAVAQLAEDAPVLPYDLRQVTDTQAPDESLRLVGFGVNDGLHLAGAGIRRWADVRVTGWGCDANSEHVSGCVPSFEMVIRAQVGVDTCAGDSGGPVLEIFNGKPRIVAVTSRGVRDGTATCGSGGVYTRVDRFRAWLDTENEK